MLITTALSQYIEYLQFRNLSPASLRRVRQEVRRLGEWTNTHVITEVSEQTLRHYFAHGVQERKWKAATTAAKRQTLSPFFNWCIARGYVADNPVRFIPRPKFEKIIPPKLTKHEAHRLLEAAYYLPYKWEFLRFRNRAMLAVCLYAGLRKMEMLTVKVTDIDIGENTIYVRAGKGRKDRIVPLSRRLRSILIEYIEHRRALHPQISELFCNASGKRAVNYNSFRHHLRLINGWSGVRFTLHKLRHTFATLMLDGGCDLYSLSKLMGHSRIETTIPYLNASIEHLRSQILKHPLD